MSSEFRLRGLIVCLPDASADDYVSVVETLIQEGLTTFALPAATADLGDVIAIFSARASFGAYRVTDATQVISAAEAGCRFVLADAADPALARAAAARGLSCHVSAMTPTEVRDVLGMDVDGALLWPADVVGHAMGGRFAELGLAERIIPLGGIGAYAAGEWLKSGSPAVGIDTTLLGDAFSGGSLVQLRDRCGSFTAVQEKHLPAD